MCHVVLVQILQVSLLGSYIYNGGTGATSITIILTTSPTDKTNADNKSAICKVRPAK